ncbi:MAG: hypothetical protein ACOY0T_06840 [Myxococcota bacterium]
MNKLFSRVLISLLLSSALACAGSHKPAETAAVAPPAPATPPPPLPPPTPGVSPVQLRQLCLNYEVSESRTWSDQLAQAEQLDKDLTAAFSDASRLADLQSCTRRAQELDGMLEDRLLAASALCDRRAHDGGAAGRKFNSDVALTRDALHASLDAAGKEKKDKQACINKISEAKPQWEKFLALANKQCSPPSDKSAAECDAKVQAACKQYWSNAPSATGAEEALQCAQTSARAPLRAPQEVRSGLRDAPLRAPGAGVALQTAILTGAADFFVERAEQEISLFAAEVLGRKLCHEDSPARPFIPRTCDLLMPCKAFGAAAKGSTSVSTSTTGSKSEPAPTAANDAKKTCDPEDPVIGATPAALHAAAKVDLENLPEVLADAVAKKDKNAACAFSFAWGVSEEVAHGAQLAEVLKDPSSVLERPFVKKHCDVHEPAILDLAAHIAAHLSGDPISVAEALRSGDHDRLIRVDRNLALNDRAKKAIADVLRRLVELDRAVATYRQNPTPEARARLVIAAVQVTLPIMIYIAPNAQNDLFTTVDFFSQLLNRDYATAIVTGSRLQVIQFMPANARNLVSLAASLAQAETSDDVRQTFKDAALPLGSWRRKNERRFGATLTGMVGYFGAFEQVLEKPAANREVRDGWTGAPSLLVGFDVHHGLSNRSRCGLHFNILDLGALASMRFSAPEVEDSQTGEKVQGANEVSAKGSPDVRIEQVFAPGAFLYFGYGPFDIGPAITFVPSLRPSQTASGDIEPLDIVRYGAVLAVDVSVLPLW